MKKIICTVLLAFITLSIGETAESVPLKWGSRILEQNAEWYGASDAQTAADNVIRFQSNVGAWPKNTDLIARISDEEIARTQSGGNANTIDNGATTTPIRFLALVSNATGNPNYRDAVLRGLDYLFAAQYPNGGFPQFFPLRQGYYTHITYNDDAMVNVLELLRDVAQSRAPFEFVDVARRVRARDAVNRGIDVILKTQIRQVDKPTGWCAQHDEVTLKPAWARAYEPPSLSGNESVGLVRFLMSIDTPSPEVVAAIEGAVTWLRSIPIRGQRLEAVKREDGRTDRFLVSDPGAPLLWARFYELETNRPLYTDRDSKPHYDFAEIGIERRSGYHYHGTWPSSLLERDYPAWRASLAAR